MNHMPSSSSDSGGGMSNTSLTVKKQWAGDANRAQPDSVSVQLYRDGTVRPYDPITRAELVKIAVGFFKLTGYPAIESKFTDIQGHWAENYIHFAAELGLVDGYLDGSFAPDKLVTRCEAMKIINHALGRAPEKDDHLLSGMTRWPDNADTSAWYYAEVQEATNSHACDWISGDSAMESWTKILPVRNRAAFETAWAANSGSVPDVPNPGEVVD